MRARGLGVATLWLLIVLARPAAAQAPPAAALPVEVAGATLAEFDSTSGTWRLEGSPVIVTRGQTVLRAPRVRFHERTRVIMVEGGADLTEPGVAVRADAAEIRL